LDNLEKQPDPQSSLTQLPEEMERLQAKISTTKTTADQARQSIEETRQQIFSDLEQIRERHRQRKDDCAKLLANSNKMQAISETMGAIDQLLDQTQAAIEAKIAAKLVSETDLETTSEADESIPENFQE
jgi:ElaB/YqjD/DUF883 family membrane-anchored ribosome-binding protein